MGEVVYRSEAMIERLEGGLRRATLPGEKEPV